MSISASTAQDLRYALRMIRKNPGFTATAVLSLALGVGANTAVFSLINAVMLRWLPVHDPQQLVQLQLVERGGPNVSFSYPVVRSLAERRELFSGVCGFSGMTLNIGTADASEPRRTLFVTGGYFQTLGLTPIAGRALTPADDEPGAEPVAVISHGFWERNFNRDPGIAGQSLVIESVPVAIVGVTAPGFAGASVGEATDITLAMSALPRLMPEGSGRLEATAQWLRVLARLREGIPMRQVNAALAVMWPQLASVAVTPKMPVERRRILLSSALEAVPGATGWSSLRSQFRRPLLVLMGVVAIVLLIACANVANLMLARAAAREKEIAVRLAMGARRSRIFRQLLTECALLAGLAALVGLVLAFFGSRFLLSMISRDRGQPVLLDLSLDWYVLAFTSGAALVTALLFGIAPALRASSSRTSSALQSESRSATGARSRLSFTLVVAQVALSLVLLVGAGLFLRTLRNLADTDPGFRHKGVLLMSVNARRAGYRDAGLAALQQELLERISRIPGVVSASLAGDTPLSGRVWSDAVSLDGQPRSQDDSAHFNSVSPGYFQTLNMRIRAGRDFTVRDTASSLPVAIVNETFVRRYLATLQPLGRGISVPGEQDRQNMEIVGVVQDALSQSLREPAFAAVYLPYAQYAPPSGSFNYQVQVAGSLYEAASTLTREVASRVPATLVQIRPLTEQVERALAQERTLATMSSGFGLLALALAGVGIFGLLAYTVTQRTREIGVRMALGAERMGIVWLIISGALKLIGAGVAVGIAGVWASSRLVSSMLFGVKATDPGTVLVSIAILTAAGLLAGVVPAHRASRIDANTALKHE